MNKGCKDRNKYNLLNNLINVRLKWRNKIYIVDPSALRQSFDNIANQSF